MCESFSIYKQRSNKVENMLNQTKDNISLIPSISPLHIAASNGHPDIMNLLISCGTHFDSTNAFQQTACDLLDEKELSRNVIQPINHTTLQCLAARVIVKHSLDYRGNIPEKLEAFVLLHR